MRRRTLFLIGVGALTIMGCPNSGLLHIVGVGGGGGGGSRRLAIIAEPSTAHVNAFIAPAIQVAVEDTLGVVDTTFKGGVTLALSTNPSFAVLAGSTTVVAVSGVATFSDLTVDRTGTGYIISAASAGLTTVFSTSFDIIP